MSYKNLKFQILSSKESLVVLRLRNAKRFRKAASFELFKIGICLGFGVWDLGFNRMGWLC